MGVVSNPDWTREAEVQRLNILYDLLAALSRAKALQDVYDSAVKSLLAATSADRAAILIFDDDGVMRFKAWRGLSTDYRQAVTGHAPWTKGTRGVAPIVMADVLEEPDLASYHEVFSREGIRALGFVPLELDAGVFGKFMLYYGEPHQCAPEELAIAQAIATHVALAAEQKRIEFACQRSEQRLQAILDYSPAVVYLKDAQGRHQLVNQRFEELSGLGKAEIIGRTDEELFSHEVAARFRENDRQVLAARKAITFEEYLPFNGRLHTYVSVKFPLADFPGAAAGVCGISTDITARKNLEYATLHLAAIVESSDDAIISKDLSGIITSWNRGAERIFGYTAEEAIGKPVSMLAPSERLNEMPNILSKIRAGERVDHYETRRRAKSGRIIDVSLTVSPIRNGSGEIIGASKIARDVTLKNRAAEERALLLSREREARETAELLNRVGPRLASQLDSERLVQEITDIATSLVGAEFGSFFHNVVNEQGESYMLYALSGVSREAFAGFPIPRNTGVFGPTFRGEGIVRCEDVTKDSRYGNNSPYNGMPKGPLPVRSYLAAPVQSRTGEVLGGLFFGHSLPGKFTENHEVALLGIASQAGIAMDNARLFQQTQWTQAELKRSNEELRRTNEDLETFAYSASHDLQEPLRTVSLCAQMLERDIAKDLRQEEAGLLTTIRHASHRMNTLIEDLLAYTKATKYPEGPPPATDLNSVLEATIESLKSQIEQADAVVTTDKLPRVPIHESRLALLFQNLLSNALKYRTEGVPRIHVSGTEQDGWSIISISDNGIGIETEYAEQIFTLFKRLHGRDEYEGSGVGLAICQRIVEQYGGRIWLDKSALGQGSTFCFAIPSAVRQH